MHHKMTNLNLSSNLGSSLIILVMLSHQLFSHLHSDWVKRIQYYPVGEILISCSNNAKDSLVYHSIREGSRKNYVFKVTKV